MAPNSVGSIVTLAVGIALLGMVVAAAVCVALDARRPRPGVAQIEQALVQLGLSFWGVRDEVDQPTDRVVFAAEDAQGPLRVTALGRDEAGTRFLARAWRSLVYRHAPPALAFTRRQQVQSEARVERAAHEKGVSVPRVLAADVVGPLALLVERMPHGRSLTEFEAADLTDSVLDAIWTEVHALHRAGIAHGKLDAHHVIVDGAAPTIVGFEAASISLTARQSAADTAQLLAATAAAVGADRAVEAAVRAIGREGLAAALPLLQPLTISKSTHDALGGTPVLDEKLEQLRTVGALAVGADPPELQKIYRVHPRQVLLALAALVAVGTLLSRIGDPSQVWNTLRTADWPLVLLAFALTLATDVVFGITFLGNIPVRIPIWPSIELQIAMAFSNLAIPVAADAAIQVRFLQRNGLDLASATATGGILSSVSEIGVQALLFIVALRFAPDTINFGHIDAGRIEILVAIALFVLGASAAITFGVQRLRHRALPPLLRALGAVWEVIRSPGRVALLVGGNIVAQLLTAGSLLACLAAFDHPVSLWTLLAINIGVSLIASLVPIPGGGAAVSAIGLAGMLTAVGVPQAVSAASVLAFQVVHSYLPAIPGWFATNDLIRREYL